MKETPVTSIPIENNPFMPQVHITLKFKIMPGLWTKVLKFQNFKLYLKHLIMKI
jgi:hypothetical protein